MWFVADARHAGDAAVAAVRREFAAVAARASTTAVATASLDDLRAVMPYDVNELAFRYGLKCFSTAVKPWVFRLLFARGHARCLYFDPDIQFYADLDELVLRLHRVAILVTPHVTRPNPDDGKWQTDLQLARTGVYNFGFLGLSRAHEPVLDHFLAWWAARLRFEGHVDLEKGLHYDQQWGAFVASFYPPDAYHVLRDPRYNVAYWNLHYRGREIRVRPSDGAATYKGAPLIFVHFSGVATDAWDPDASLSPHQTRFRLGDFPNLAPLFRDYARATAGAARHRAACRYGLAAFDNGAPVPYWLRGLPGSLVAAGRARARGPPAPARAELSGSCPLVPTIDVAPDAETVAVRAGWWVFRVIVLISTQAPAPPYAEALGALDLSNPFATAPANSLWRWLLKHRHDEPPTRAACGDRDCWFPNVVLLTLDAFGVSTRAFPAAADARAFFARFGALMAWGLGQRANQISRRLLPSRRASAIATRPLSRWSRAIR